MVKRWFLAAALLNLHLLLVGGCPLAGLLPGGCSKTAPAAGDDAAANAPQGDTTQLPSAGASAAPAPADAGAVADLDQSAGAASDGGGGGGTQLGLGLKGPKLTRSDGSTTVSADRSGVSVNGQVGPLPVSAGPGSLSAGAVSLAKSGLKVNPLALADTVTGGVVSDYASGAAQLVAMKAARDAMGGPLTNLYNDIKQSGANPYAQLSSDDIWMKARKATFNQMMMSYVSMGDNYNALRTQLGAKYPAHSDDFPPIYDVRPAF